jgi:hypothetical protein
MSNKLKKSQQAVGQNLSPVLLYQEQPIGQQLVVQFSNCFCGYNKEIEVELDGFAKQNGGG